MKNLPRSFLFFQWLDFLAKTCNVPLQALSTLSSVSQGDLRRAITYLQVSDAFFSLLFSRFMSWLSCLYSVLHYFCVLLTDLVNQELWSCYLYKLNYKFLLVIFHFLLVQKAWSRLSLNPYHSLRLFTLKYWFLTAFLIPWDRTEHNLMLSSLPLPLWILLQMSDSFLTFIKHENLFH
jgi:hypothetical protein